jgi:DNA-binding Lrp family transcriptional regulator
MIDDRKFIDAAAKGLPIEAEPFAGLAKQLGMTEDEVIATLARLIDEKKVRRFAASVRHQHIGYSHNAMLIARVKDADAVAAVGEAAARIPEVSHCYERPHPDGWAHCVYIMVHGRERSTVDAAVERVRTLPGIDRLEVLPSMGELKKTSLSGVSSAFSPEEVE